MTKQAVIYARTARPEGSQAAIERQAAACRAYAGEHGYSVVGIYSDVGSGLDPNRAGLNELFTTIESMQGSQTAAHTEPDIAVLIYDGDRLARSVALYQNVERRLNALGVKVVSVSEAIDGTPAAARLARAGVAQHIVAADVCAGGRKSGKPVDYASTLP